MRRWMVPQRRAYNTDLTDSQWKLIAPLIPERTPAVGRTRRLRRVGERDPPFPACRHGLAPAAARPAALADGLLLLPALGSGGRVAAGTPYARDGRPRARRAGAVAVGRRPRQPDRLDGRSKGGCKGCDAGKKIHGRKRHILTDTDGRLLPVEVHAADIKDRDGAKGVLRRSRSRFPFVEHVYADGGYVGRLVGWRRPRRIWSWRSSDVRAAPRASS